jgi:hypothetical protein
VPLLRPAEADTAAKQAVDVLRPLDDESQFSFEHFVTEVLIGHPVVVIDHLLPKRCIVQDALGLLDCFLVQKSIKGNRPKSTRLDIGAVDQIAVADHRSAMIDLLEKRVSESFVFRRIGDQICLGD